MGPDMDMSIVWRDDCGHMQVEVEFCDPSDLLNKQRAWILVSLPMIARWHTSERFNTERILRQSGKFDYSEPQFFDVLFINSNSKLNLPGPLIVHPSIEIMCEYETRNVSSRVPLDSSTQVITLNESSTLPCHKAIIRGLIMSPREMLFTKFYGQLSHVFYNYQSQIRRAGNLEKIQRLLESSSDLNNFFLSSQLSAYADSDKLITL